MNNDLISRSALKEAFKKKCCCEISLDLIDNAPTVPQGKWITSKIDGEKYNCSECGGACWYYDYRGDISKSNFCPNCGADMRGE